MSKLKAGQTIFLIEKSNQVMPEYSDAISVTVSKVTKKYFYLEDTKYKHLRFSIETLSSGRLQCYLTYLHIERERKTRQYYVELCRYFSEYKECPLSLEQLQNIRTIIGL